MKTLKNDYRYKIISLAMFAATSYVQYAGISAYATNTYYGIADAKGTNGLAQTQFRSMLETGFMF